MLLYPKTIMLLINSGKNIHFAIQLSSTTRQKNITTLDKSKTQIVFMFDGGWRSVYSEGYPIMKKYNYNGNVSIIPSLVDEKDYMSYYQIAELYLQGWDLLNHTFYHKANMYDSCEELLSDFNKARQWMENRFISNCSNMIVMPYGEINPFLLKLLKDEGYCNVRTSDNIIVLNNDMITYYPIITINLLTDLTVDEVKGLLKQTFDEPKVIIMILQKIDETNNGLDMTYSKDKLEEIIIFIDEHKDKLQVITYSELF